MNDKIVFLDIDGVLNNDTYARATGSYSNFDPVSIDQLNRILVETGAKLVISSTWRCLHIRGDDKDIEGFDKRLELAGVVPGRVIDFTPLPRMTSHRGREIQQWLTEHPDITDWVALDDLWESEMRPLDKGRVVRTTEEFGLQIEHADKAIAILGKV